MAVIPFPDRSRLLRQSDREAIARFAAGLPDAELVFTETEDGHPYAAFAMGRRLLILEREDGAVVVHDGCEALARAPTVAEALAMLERRPAA